MIKKLLRYFRAKPHLHPCDLCSKMMEANGFGMCDDCMTACNELDGEQFHEFVKKLPRFSGEVG